MKNAEIESFPQPEAQLISDVSQRSVELAAFLDGVPVDTVQIESVIAHARLGVMYKVTLGKTMETAEAQTVLIVHRTDNMAFERLEIGFNLMSKRKRKKHKNIIRQMRDIEEYVSDAANWPGNNGRGN